MYVCLLLSIKRCRKDKREEEEMKARDRRLCEEEEKTGRDLFRR